MRVDGLCLWYICMLCKAFLSPRFAQVEKAYITPEFRNKTHTWICTSTARLPRRLALDKALKNSIPPTRDLP